jgi:hypothetical protein
MERPGCIIIGYGADTNFCVREGRYDYLSEERSPNRLNVLDTGGAKKSL